MTPLIEVKNLKTHFHTEDGIVRAVDGIDFSIEPEKTLGIVGESGCGKSVTALSIWVRLFCDDHGQHLKAVHSHFQFSNLIT